MATKLEEKKAAIGYIPGDPPSCGNCELFTSIIWKRTRSWSSTSYEKELNLRCSLHGFATKKMAYCNDFRRKVTK